MEKDTVLLSLVRYHALQEAERQTKNHTICVNYIASGNTTQTCHTDDDAVAKMATELKEASEEILKQNNEIYNLKSELLDIKKMSVFGFWRWKFKQ